MLLESLDVFQFKAKLSQRDFYNINCTKLEEIKLTKNLLRGNNFALKYSLKFAKPTLIKQTALYASNIPKFNCHFKMFEESIQEI